MSKCNERLIVEVLKLLDIVDITSCYYPLGRCPGVHSQRCFADLRKQPRLVPASLSVHNTVDKERKVTCGLLCDLSCA